jgi:hypothetical protein
VCQCAAPAMMCMGIGMGGGTCVDLQTDAEDCGTCGHNCGMGATCVAGTCTCPAGETDCPGVGAFGGGCFDLLTSKLHCGTCATVCTGATPTCTAGMCTM